MTGISKGGGLVAAAVVAATLLAACGPSPTSTPEGSPTGGGTGSVGSAAGLAPDTLANMTYTLPDGTSVALVDGKYEEPAAPGSATMGIAVTLIEDLTAHGDLNGDGVPDAAVILVNAPGGSGVFAYLAAVVNESGTPQNVSTVDLGDRTQINTNQITAGADVLDVVAHAASDPLCCPTEHRQWTYALEGGVLEQTDDQLLGTVTPVAAAGGGEAIVGKWQWLLTTMNDDTNKAPGDPANYTVTFGDDGSVSVQADCNSVAGSYEADASGIAMSLGPMTMAECPPGSLSGDFVQDLAAAALWSLDEGNLMLTLRYDSGTIRLAPAATP